MHILLCTLVGGTRELGVSSAKVATCIMQHLHAPTTLSLQPRALPFADSSPDTWGARKLHIVGERALIGDGPLVQMGGYQRLGRPGPSRCFLQ